MGGTVIYAHRNTDRGARIMAAAIAETKRQMPKIAARRTRQAIIELSRRYERERLDEAAAQHRREMERIEELRAVEISNFHSEWAVEAKETAKHHTVRPSQIMAEVADKHGIHVADIISLSRHRTIYRARAEATVRIYVECRDAFGARLSLPAIGRIVRRDHSSLRRTLILEGVYMKK